MNIAVAYRCIAMYRLTLFALSFEISMLKLVYIRQNHENKVAHYRTLIYDRIACLYKITIPDNTKVYNSEKKNQTLLLPRGIRADFN